MKIKELSGVALTWAAAQALKYEVVLVVNKGVPQVWFKDDVYSPTKGVEPTAFVDGKPVSLFGNPVELELSEEILNGKKIAMYPSETGWKARLVDHSNRFKHPYIHGYSFTEAFYRCVVYQVFGGSVTLPDAINSIQRDQS